MTSTPRYPAAELDESVNTRTQYPPTVGETVGEGCFWRVVNQTAQVNATCVNDRMISKIVAQRGGACFDGCDAGETNGFDQGRLACITGGEPCPDCAPDQAQPTYDVGYKACYAEAYAVCI